MSDSRDYKSVLFGSSLDSSDSDDSDVQCTSHWTQLQSIFSVFLSIFF